MGCGCVPSFWCRVQREVELLFLCEVDRSGWWNEGIEIQDIETTRDASEMIDILCPASFEHPFEHPLIKKARCIQYRVMPESPKVKVSMVRIPLCK